MTKQLSVIKVIGQPEERTTPNGKTAYKLPVTAETSFNGQRTNEGMYITFWDIADIVPPGDYYLGARAWKGPYNEMKLAPILIPIQK